MKISAGRAMMMRDSDNYHSRQEIERLKQENAEQAALIKHLEASNQGLSEHLTKTAGQARKDKDRLDWLEETARKSYTGISFDWVPSVDGEPSGFRFMRRHFIGDACSTLRTAIDKAKELP